MTPHQQEGRGGVRGRPRASKTESTKKLLESVQKVLKQTGSGLSVLSA